MAEKGRLKVQAFVGDSFIPLDNATVRIRPSFGDGTQKTRYSCFN